MSRLCEKTDHIAFLENQMLDDNSFDGEFEETPLLDSTHLNDIQKKVKCDACDYKTHNRKNLKRHHMTVHRKSKTK